MNNEIPYKDRNTLCISTGCVEWSYTPNKSPKTCLLFDIRSSSGAKIKGRYWMRKVKKSHSAEFSYTTLQFQKHSEDLIPPLTMKKILNGKYFIRVTLHVPHPVKTFKNAVVFSLFIRFSKTKSAWQSSFNCTNFCSIDVNELTRRQRTAIHQCEPTLNYILSKWHSKYFSYFETEQPLNKRIVLGRTLKSITKQIKMLAKNMVKIMNGIHGREPNEYITGQERIV